MIFEDFKIGDKVEGESYWGIKYTGTVIGKDSKLRSIHVLRDDGQEGFGINYKEKKTWLCCENEKGTILSNGYMGSPLKKINI